MGIRRRRKKLTTLMSRLDQRVRSVELRPISLLTDAQIAAAVETGDISDASESFVGDSAPNQFYKIQDAYVYAKELTSVSSDRVEIYMEADLNLYKGDRIEVSGLNGTSALAFDASGDEFIVQHTDVPPWTDRATWKHDPEEDQLPGVSITNTYSFNPDSIAPKTWNDEKERLQTRRKLDSYEVTGTTVTLNMNASHRFKVGDIIYVDIYEENSTVFGLDGLFRVSAVTSNTITYELDAGPLNPITETVPEEDVYVFPVARKWCAVGSTWTDSSDDGTVYYWDGIRWASWSTETLAPDDNDPPMPPTDLVVESSLNVVDGEYSSATVSVEWTAPTQTVAEEPLDDLAGYYIRWKKSSASEYQKSIYVKPDETSYKDDGSSYKWSVGGTYNFQVWAVDSGGNESAILSGSHTLPAATTIPLTSLKPSDPISYLHLGTVAITWDGEMSDGSAAPANLSVVEFHRSLSSDFTASSSTLVGTAVALPNTKLVFSDQTIGSTYYYRLRLRGITPGSFSLQSDQIAVSTVALVDAQKIADIIKGANITPGTIVAGDNIIGFTVTGNLIQGNVIHANVLEANSITALQIDTGSITADIVSSGFLTTRGYSVVGDQPQYTGAGITIDNSIGLVAYNSGGSPTFSIQQSTGIVTIGTHTAATLDALSATATAAQTTAGNAYDKANAASNAASDASNTASGASSLASDAQNNIDNVKSNVYYPGTTQINGGSIRTETIVADALAADVISAYLISSSREIKLASTLTTVWPRISINKDRIAAFNSSGTATFRLYANGDFYADDIFIDSASVSGSVTGGRIRTASSGKRVELDGPNNQVSIYNTSGGLAGSLEGGASYVELNSALGGQLSVGTGVSMGNATIDSLSAYSDGVILRVADTTTAAANLRRPSSSTNLAVFTSDSRVKDQVTSISSGLSVVANLNPVTFKSLVDTTDKTFSGFIAQEIQTLFPSETYTIVTEEEGMVPKVDGADPDDYAKNPLLSLNSIELLPYLTKAIQELAAKVDELQAKIDAAGI